MASNAIFASQSSRMASLRVYQVQGHDSIVSVPRDEGRSGYDTSATPTTGPSPQPTKPSS